MIRVHLHLLCDGESSAADVMRHAADMIEEGYLSGDLRNEDVDSGGFTVEEPCPYGYCDGSGRITEGQFDDLQDKDCLCRIDVKADDMVSAMRDES